MTAPSAPGTSRFQIRRCLGAGGFGTVYEAFDTKRHATVALKVLRSQDPDALYRFKQEFRALSELTHPNLITLYELSTDGAAWCFSMELIDGADFLSYVREGDAAAPHTLDSSPGPYSPTVSSEEGLGADGGQAQQGRRAGPAGAVSVERLVGALVQLGQGLATLHQAGQVHRDIKPGNVLCTAAGRLVLLDFGLAHELLAAPGASTGDIVGTPDYMSPEQAAGEPLSPATDWYSVGVMLYEALTGYVPFAGTAIHVLRQKIEQDAPPPEPLQPGTQPALVDLCRRLLHRRPELRPGGEEVLAALRALSAAAAGDGADAGAAPHRPTPFVGRAEQLAALEDAYGASRQGRAVVALCHGGSGAGKSVLCRRFLRELAERDGQAVVLSGRCYEHEDVPFKALDGVIDALSGALRRRLRKELATLLPRDVAVLARLFPVLRQVPEVQEAPERRIADADLARQAAFAALRELLLRLSDRRPVVLYIDDLQWGDPDGIELLLQVLRPPDPPPLLLIVSYRSEEQASSPALQLLSAGLRGPLAAAVTVREVPVAELSGPESEALALALLPEPDPARAAAIAAEGRGNPLFVSELSRFLAEGLPAEGERATLDHVLRARVARLPEPCRVLLQILAVAGQPIARAAAARAAFGEEGEGEGEEPKALARLRAERLARLRHTDDGGGGTREELLPYHDRVREAVIDGLPADALAAQHLRLGLALEASGQAEPERLVYHFQRGGDLLRVARYAVQAAAGSQRALAYHQVVRLCRAALASGALTPAETDDVNARLADALAATGRPKEAGAAYLALAEREGPAGALQRRRQAARQLMAGGYLDEGMAVLRQILAAVRLPLPASTFRIVVSVMLHHLLLTVRGLRFRERAESAVPPTDLLRVDTCEAVSSIASTNPMLSGYFLMRGLWLALRAGEPRRIAHALSGESLMLSGMGVPLQRIAPALARARALGERMGDRYAVGRALFVEGHAEHLDGSWRQSSGSLERAAEILRADCPEAAPQLDLIAALKVYNRRYLGDLLALAEEVPPLLKEAMEQGRRSNEAIVRMIAGFLLPLREDDPDGAEATVRTAEERFAGQPFNLQHVFALDARLMILLYRGQGDEAWRLLGDNGRDLAECGQLRIRFFDLMFRNLRALVALAAGQPLRVAEAEARRLARGRARYAPPMAALIRALVRARKGRRAEALRLLEDAERGFSAAEMALHAACVRLRRGEWLGGDEGGRLIEAARVWMAGQGIRSPERMAAMIAPAR